MAPRERQVLTDAKIRNIKPQARPFNVTDGDGLFLYVQTNGSKCWRYGFRYLGKRKTLALGTYPEMSLARARELLAEARTHVAAGRDPCALKQEAKAAKKREAFETFEAVSRAWLTDNGPYWSETHRRDQARRLDKDILPLIGAKPIKEFKASELVALLRDVSKRGLETAKRTRVIIQSVFRYAVNIGVLDADPTTTLKDALKPPKPTHFAAPTDPSKVGEILRAIDADRIAGPIVHCALRLHPLVAVRPGELRQARWADFDFEENEWCFKASKTGQDHIVPLSRQALAILEQLKPFSFGRSEWVFPSIRSLRTPMSNGTLGASLERIGIRNDTLVPHGWRAVFRTLGRERCKFDREWLEMQLAHSVPDALGAAYNRTQWIDERRVMMQQWADYLDELKAGAPK